MLRMRRTLGRRGRAEGGAHLGVARGSHEGGELLQDADVAGAAVLLERAGHARLAAAAKARLQRQAAAAAAALVHALREKLRTALLQLLNQLQLLLLELLALRRRRLRGLLLVQLAA